MSAHTPGPWTVAPDFSVKGADGWAIKYNSGWSEDAWEGKKCDEECQANARIIAAAPELLDACKFALECTNGGDFTMDGPNGKRTVMMGRILRAAIAKAEGRDA